MEKSTEKLRRIANSAALPGYGDVIDALKILAKNTTNENSEIATRIAERAYIKLEAMADAIKVQNGLMSQKQAKEKYLMKDRYDQT